METLNLKTRLNAYAKVSNSILEKYVTKDALDSKLEDYVTEAPQDNKVYGRENKTWVELVESAKETEKLLVFGANNQLQLDTVEEIMTLDGRHILQHGESSYKMTYNQKEDGILWIVCTAPIKSIVWEGLNMIADYTKQKAVLTDGDVNFYCYHITEALVANTWSFTINL